MMQTSRRPFRVLIADDDADDVQLTRECFSQNQFLIDVNDVSDGQTLIEHLNEVKKTLNVSTLPQLILLDLNMPRKSGFEALKEIKEDEILRKIPVIILSTSMASKDIQKAYELGASCFVTKPHTMTEWCEKMGKLGRFWLECVRLVD